MHEQFMRLALAQAAQSGSDVPVGAVIVHDGQVIASATAPAMEWLTWMNSTLNLPARTVCPASTVVSLVERACRALHTRRLSGCTLYVTLEPCPMCAGAMVMAQLDGCVFGAYDARQGCCGSVYDLPHDPAFFHRVPCAGGVLENECARLLRAFFERRRGDNAPSL